MEALVSQWLAMLLVMIATQAELMKDDFNACLSCLETET
jgi:hypothetical protein